MEAETKRSFKIFIVEDDAVDTKLLKRQLSQTDLDITTVSHAESLQDAISTLKQEQYDVVLLDMNLPDMDGAKLYPMIKEVRPNLKVIVCTGYSLNGPAREILNAGAQGFIQKPFSLNTLTTKVKEVLEGQ